LQSLLTGQLFIQLNFQPGTPINLVGDGMYQSKYDEIPTLPTPIERLSKSLQDFPADKVLKNIAAITEGMDKLVNSPQLTESVTALHAALDELKSLTTKINTEASPLASNANSMVDDARAVLGNINTAVDDAKGALRQAEITLKSTDDLVGNEQLVIQMEQALTAITSAARSIQLLAEEIERRPESLIRGRQ
jgi:paraquat-inducible protein B